MSIERVRQYFQENHIPEEIREFSVSSATVELAAHALHVEPQLIAKTLSFATEDSAILVIAAGDARIDNKKFKTTFGYKAKMLAPDDVLHFTGHTIGGVCPFALPQPLNVYLDASLKRFEIIYPAAGNDHSAVVITPDRLQEVTNAQWVDVCKIPE